MEGYRGTLSQVFTEYDLVMEIHTPKSWKRGIVRNTRNGPHRATAY